MSQPRFNDVTELSEKTATALLQFVLSFADTKHFLGRRISEWVTAAPVMEASVAAANITQEELGHARSLFAMARDIPAAPPELNSENDLSRQKFYNPSYLNHPWQSWFEVIATFFLLDSALATIIASAKNASLKPLRQRVAKILQEEHFHRVYYEGWFERLAQISAKSRNQLEAALENVWPVAAAWFGPPEDTSFDPLLEVNIFLVKPQQAFGQWEAYVESILAKNEISYPKRDIDWSKWDAMKREVASEHENNE